MSAPVTETAIAARRAARPLGWYYRTPRTCKHNMRPSLAVPAHGLPCHLGRAPVVNFSLTIRQRNRFIGVALESERD